jgi:hypothetical protein
MVTQPSCCFKNCIPYFVYIASRVQRGRYRMVVGFTTNYSISAYQH